MAKQTTASLVSELFGKTSKIKLNQAAGIFGTTSNQSLLQELNKNIADLGQAISKGSKYPEIMQKYELVAGSIDTAGITGLISEQELVEYYDLVDSIWSAIEKEYGN